DADLPLGRELIAEGGIEVMQRHTRHAVTRINPDAANVILGIGVSTGAGHVAILAIQGALRAAVVVCRHIEGALEGGIGQRVVDAEFCLAEIGVESCLYALTAGLAYGIEEVLIAG